MLCCGVHVLLKQKKKKAGSCSRGLKFCPSVVAALEAWRLLPLFSNVLLAVEVLCSPYCSVLHLYLALSVHLWAVPIWSTVTSWDPAVPLQGPTSPSRIHLSCNHCLVNVEPPPEGHRQRICVLSPLWQLFLQVSFRFMIPHVAR